MTDVLRHSGRHGTYQIEKKQQCIIVTLSGAVSADMAQRYYQDLSHLVTGFHQQPWAYVADAREYQASTPDALEYIHKAFLFCIKHHCVSDAYCLNSALAIAQLQEIRQQCGLKTPIKGRLFPSLEQGLTYSFQQLSLEA